jgi:hypothetical protein
MLRIIDRSSFITMKQPSSMPHRLGRSSGKLIVVIGREAEKMARGKL